MIRLFPGAAVDVDPEIDLRHNAGNLLRAELHQEVFPNGQRYVVHPEQLCLKGVRDRKTAAALQHAACHERYGSC